MVENITHEATTFAKVLSCRRLRNQYRMSLEENAVNGHKPRLCESQTLKLMTMLLDPKQHTEAITLIEYGIPKQWELSHGHFGETLTLLAGLGITEGFLQPVSQSWKNLYQ